MVWRGKHAPHQTMGREKTRRSSVVEEYKEEGKVLKTKT